jgi:2-polyprenyl-3-methyl-5-hydroxy-6-metoxy-1,4-benzoquinol methylase
MTLHMLPQTRAAADRSPRPPTLLNPVTRSFQAMAVVRSIGVAARTGVFGALADGPAQVSELAERLGFRCEPLRLMLDVLVGEGLLSYHEPKYELSMHGQRWLDPESPTSVTTYLSHSLDYWDLWSGLEQLVSGHPVPAPLPDADDEAAWLRATRGDYEAARLIAADVAAAIDLPRSADSVLDLGGGHGAFAAALCQQNPRLRATVIDHPAAVSIGREIMWEAEMDSVVEHRSGDLYTADLGGPHDAVLCLPMMLDLASEEATELLHRIRSVLKPDGVLVLLRVMQPTPSATRMQFGASAALELFLRLQLGTADTGGGRLSEQLTATGFGPPRIHRWPSVHDVSLHVARAVPVVDRRWA